MIFKKISIILLISIISFLVLSLHLIIPHYLFYIIGVVLSTILSYLCYGKYLTLIIVFGLSSWVGVVSILVTFWILFPFMILCYMFNDISNQG